MDSIIYDYLIKNENKTIDDQNDDQQGDNDNQIFLDCLLILSINKINIDYNTLLHYCNNIIKNDNNNKRIIRNLENNDGEDIYYGLNNNQFNILYKVIKSLYNVVDSGSIINQGDHPISNNSKFDCSILIIIKNNLKLKQQQQTHKLSKIIKLNKDSCRGGLDYSYLLFKKVWGNLVIRNEIIVHLRLFNIHKEKIRFHKKQLRDYKFRNYINSLELYNNVRYGLYESSYNSDLKKNDGDDDTFSVENHSKYISTNVKNLELSYFKVIEKNSIPSTVSKLILGGSLNQKLTKDLFNNIGGIGSDNITTLVFGDYFNQSLSDDDDDSGNGEAWLPNNLTSLEFGSSFQQTILPGQLPNSLTSLILQDNYEGRILPHSIPKSVTTLNYTFNSNGNKIKLDKYSIPSSTTNLIFDDDFDQVIKIGDIPDNVTSITFGGEFNKTIKAGSLPHLLQSLDLSGYAFNQPINDNGILPSHLTTLILGNEFNQSILNTSSSDQQSCFPISITKLHFGQEFNQPINNSFSHLSNLKDLKITLTTSNNEIGVLPKSIKSLDLGCFQNPLTSNILSSSSLTSLTYYHYNKSIPPNTLLPNSITSLIMCNPIYCPSDIPNPLPPNLKSITLPIDNDFDLSLIDWWPSSLETIYIGYYKLSLINNTPTDFVTKYIKPKYF